MPQYDSFAQVWDEGAGHEGVWHQRHDIDPVMWELIGSVDGLKVLEIGCGNGYFARKLARAGAAVTAVDISPAFIEIAKGYEAKDPLSIQFLLRDAAELDGLDSNAFDLVIANMSFMDVPDIEDAMAEIGRVLTNSGRLVFSLTHPVFEDLRQSRTLIQENGETVMARVIPNYLTSQHGDFKLGEETVVQYHRPIGTYMRLLKSVGMCVEDLREIPTKQEPELATEEDGDISLRRFKYRTEEEKQIRERALKEFPLFLIIAARKV